jgi:hypothetical protein
MAVPGNKLKVPKAIADQVQLINDTVPLPQPLRLGAVARCLIELGKDTAIEVLNGLVEDAVRVEDPNVWVLEAAQAIWDMGPDAPQELVQGAGIPQQGGIGGFGLAPQPLLQEMAVTAGGRREMAVRAGGRQDKMATQLNEMVLKRIQWLNQNGSLIQRVDLSRVSGALAATPQAQQLAVMTRLKDQAPCIEDPNAWLIKELRIERRQQQIRGGVVAAIGEVTVRRIEWLNQKGGLVQPLELQAARGPLQTVTPDSRAEVLNTLKEQAAVIANPAEFLVAECRRIRAEALETAALGGDEEAANKLAKKRKKEDIGEGIAA